VARLVAAGLVVCLALLATGLHAQELYGTVVGTVADPSGGAVPGASVTLINTDTNLTRTSVSDERGAFEFSNVLAGPHDLTVELEGFRTGRRTDVRVTAGALSRVNVTLELGPVAESVVVASSATRLQTDTTEVRSELASKEITDLPTNNFRNYQALLDLVPGTTPGQFANDETNTPARALTTNVNGLDKSNNSTRVDGARNLFTWLPHHTLYVPNAETIESVGITTGSFNADQGMATGALVTVITKSGTNEFRGTGYGSYNNQSLNAATYFGHQRQPSRHVVGAASLGGPIRRNRLFFFGAWEYQDRPMAGERFYSVPPTPVRAGDFSRALNADGSLQVIYDPLTGAPDGTGRQPFAGNMIPRDRLSAVSRSVQDTFYPVPNFDADSHLVTFATDFRRSQYDLKVNWNISATHQGWVKAGVMDAEVAGLVKLGFDEPGTGFTRVYAGAIGETWTVSPTMVLDATLGYTRLDQQVYNADFGTNWGSDVFGIPGTNGPDIRQSGMPTMSMGYEVLGTSEPFFPLFRDDPTWTFAGSLAKVAGRHTLRAGVRVDHLALNHWQPEVGVGARGAFFFGGGVTSLNGGAQAANHFNSYAAFLLGLPTSTGKTVQHEVMTTREWQLNVHVADRWQLIDNLTINAGLRWEAYPLVTRRNRGIERLDFETMEVLLGGVGGNPRDLGIETRPHLSPNAGAAWRIGESSVVRAGYGHNVNPLPFSRPLRGFYPLTIAYGYIGANSYQPSGRLEDGIPPVSDPDVSTGRLPLPDNVETRTPDPQNVERGYTQSWNLAYEHRLPGDLSLTTAYVGTRGIGGFADRELNWSPPGGGREGRQLYAEWERIAGTQLWGSFTHRNYHALQVSANRAFRNGLMLRGAYTWSKAMNEADDDGWERVIFNSPSQFSRNYARAGYDRTHNLQLAWLWEVPLGRTDRGGRLLRTLIRDWQLNGTFSAYSGVPLTVTSDATSLNGFGDQQTADQIGPLNRLEEFGPGRYFYDPASWAPVTETRYGTSGRNSIRGPGYWTLNLGLFRTLPLGGRWRLQLRGEAWNIFNRPMWGNPDTDVSSPTFMEVRSAGGLRRMQVGGRLIF
jgi:hypothetical protein